MNKLHNRLASRRRDPLPPLALAAALAVFLTAAQPDVSLTMHAPTRDYLVRPGYLMSYNGMARCPRWVLERIIPGEESLEAPREEAVWRADHDIPGEFAPAVADYEGTGYDRGHLAAAEDQDETMEMLKASFLITNAVPEMPYINRGVWRSIEAETRGLANGGDVRSVWVLTAPAWLPQGYAERNKRTKSAYYFAAIGKSRIWVPTHICRTVLIERDGSRYDARAWIVPNRENTEKDPAHWRTSVDEFERAVGLDAWHALPSEIEEAVEK